MPFTGHGNLHRHNGACPHHCPLTDHGRGAPRTDTDPAPARAVEAHSKHACPLPRAARPGRLATFCCSRIVDRRACSPRRGAGFYCSDAALGGCAAVSIGRLAAHGSGCWAR